MTEGPLHPKDDNLRASRHNPAMNRERFAWAVCILMLAFLAVQLPGTFAARDNEYDFVRRLIDIHRQVSSNYVENVDESNLHESAIAGMLEELDPFTVYIPPSQQEQFDRMLEGSFKGVGIQLNMNDRGQVEVISPIEGSPAFKAGVMAGDIITKVNGEPIEGLRLPDVIKKIGGELGSEVTLTVRRITGEEHDLTMQRQEIVVPTTKGYRRKPDDSWEYFVSDRPKVAYLRLTQFTPDTYESVRTILEQLLAEGMQGLIFDLRFNPGGRLDQAIQVVDMFLDKGVILSTKGRNRPEKTEYATAEGTLPKFPMIVLINEHSASAAEIVAGSLKDQGRAVVVGTRSYGKGSVQEVIPLDENSGELKLTVAYYYLPSGRLVHKRKGATDWGVEPQIPVGMDEQTQMKLSRAMDEAERFHRPVSNITTQPTTRPPTTAEATPLDNQLQTAVSTMIALIVFEDQRETGTIDRPRKLQEPAKEPEQTTKPLSPSATSPTETTNPATEPTNDEDLPVVQPAPEPATGPATQSIP